jgi:hypothetical protein
MVHNAKEYDDQTSDGAGDRDTLITAKTLNQQRA